MLEELLIRHCAPTLAGLKTANMFSCAVSSWEEINDRVRGLNRILNSKGLRVLPLRCNKGRALIYVYRPSHLARDLSESAVSEMLESYGYPDGCPERRIATLIRRLRENDDFPHEIGLFLGYPIEDVIGFITNHACNSKLTGCWKVYGDEREASRTFEKYKRCTAAYYKRWSQGISVEQLAVAS